MKRPLTISPALWRGFRFPALIALSLFVATSVAIGFDRAASGQARTVVIDIKPGDEPTTVDPRRDGMLPVAILSGEDFDAQGVDAETVRFGATGTEAAPVRSMAEDVDDDGDGDMILLFRNQETKIPCGATSATLRGRTQDGEEFEGSEKIRTVGC